MLILGNRFMGFIILFSVFDLLENFHIKFQAERAQPLFSVL